MAKELVLGVECLRFSTVRFDRLLGQSRGRSGLDRGRRMLGLHVHTCLGEACVTILQLFEE